MAASCSHSLMQTLEKVWENSKVIIYVNLYLRLGFT